MSYCPTMLRHIFNPSRCVWDMSKKSLNNGKIDMDTCHTSVMWVSDTNLRSVEADKIIRHLYEVSDTCRTSVKHWCVSDTATHLLLEASVVRSIKQCFHKNTLESIYAAEIKTNFNQNCFLINKFITASSLFSSSLKLDNSFHFHTNL